MSIQIKNNLKRSSRLVGILLFAFLFFFNIKIMLSDDSSGIADLSLFGIKVSLFETAFAEQGDTGYKELSWKYKNNSYHYCCNRATTGTCDRTNYPRCVDI